MAGTGASNRRRVFVAALWALAVVSPCRAQVETDAIGSLVERLPAAFRQYSVVLEPDKDEPEWWAGAPSVARDRAGTIRTTGFEPAGKALSRHQCKMHKEQDRRSEGDG
jgi:hypothetical protein